MHSNTRQALNESTRSVYAKWYWVNHGRLTSERQAHQRTETRQARALKRQASCLCTRTLEHELKRQASCLCTRTLEHEMVLGKSRQDNHALEHKSRQAHQRTIMHSNTRTLEHEMVLGKSRQDNHALEHSTVSRQAKSRQASAQAPSFLSFTRRRVRSTRRRGNHMHDHSRFQRDID